MSWSRLNRLDQRFLFFEIQAKCRMPSKSTPEQGSGRFTLGQATLTGACQVTCIQAMRSKREPWRSCGSRPSDELGLPRPFGERGLSHGLVSLCTLAVQTKNVQGQGELVKGWFG